MLFIHENAFENIVWESVNWRPFSSGGDGLSYTTDNFLAFLETMILNIVVNIIHLLI